MVQYLLDKGFILLPNDGALHAACQKASLAIFHLLINHPSKHYGIPNLLPNSLFLSHTIS